jgi:hypothetical protein
MRVVTAEDVHLQMYKLAKLNKKKIKSYNDVERHLRATFGFDALTVALTWNMLVRYVTLPDCASVKYLLYMCSYLKNNCTYSFYCQFFEVSYRTFYTWVWFFAKNVARLPVVSTDMPFQIFVFKTTYIYIF